MRKRSVVTGSTIILLTSVLLATLLFPNGWLADTAASIAQAATRPGNQGIAQCRVTAGDLQALFFVWASGTPAIQLAAAQDCRRLALSAKQCAQISAATHAAWLDMVVGCAMAHTIPASPTNPALT